MFYVENAVVGAWAGSGCTSWRAKPGCCCTWEPVRKHRRIHDPSQWFVVQKVSPCLCSTRQYLQGFMYPKRVTSQINYAFLAAASSSINTPMSVCCSHWCFYLRPRSPKKFKNVQCWPFVCLSVRLSHCFHLLCSCHRIILKFSRVITIDEKLCPC